MAADPEEAHFVDIPLRDGEEYGGTNHYYLDQHPLREISESPGHLLLLKLWQREEDLSARRIACKEIRLEESKSEVFRLCSLFLAFHAVFLNLLFTYSAGEGRRACGAWWVPGGLSAATSMVLAFAVQTRVCRFWRASKELQRERGGARALQRCVQELRMKGRSFDLSKEPQEGKRMKSSSVEVKWRPIGWCLKNLPAIVLLCFTTIAVPLCKFVICG